MTEQNINKLTEAIEDKTQSRVFSSKDGPMFFIRIMNDSTHAKHFCKKAGIEFNIHRSSFDFRGNYLGDLWRFIHLFSGF